MQDYEGTEERLRANTEDIDTRRNQFSKLSEDRADCEKKKTEAEISLAQITKYRDYEEGKVKWCLSEQPKEVTAVQNKEEDLSALKEDIACLDREIGDKATVRYFLS